KSLPSTPPWYIEKTLIKRVTKTLPTNPKLAQVIALFDREDAADMDDEALDPSMSIQAPSRTDEPSIADSAAEASYELADRTMPAKDEKPAPAQPPGQPTKDQIDRFLSALDNADISNSQRDILARRSWNTETIAAEITRL